jgi:hypothetical protein
MPQNLHKYLCCFNKLKPHLRLTYFQESNDICGCQNINIRTAFGSCVLLADSNNLIVTMLALNTQSLTSEIASSKQNKARILVLFLKC